MSTGRVAGWLLELMFPRMAAIGAAGGSTQSGSSGVLIALSDQAMIGLWG
jgi:hypothetical protein